MHGYATVLGALQSLHETVGPAETTSTTSTELLGTAALVLQVTVASYALWLNRILGSRRAGWALCGAFVLMVAMHLNEVFFPPLTVSILALKPQLAYCFISLLLLISLSHLSSVYRERQKAEEALRKHRDELELRVQERTSELAEEVEQRKRAEQEIRAALAEQERMAAEVEKTQNELLVASRQAGMAEVATSVLHNVGNVVNSLNVSAQTVAVGIEKLPVDSLSKLSDLVKQHLAELDHFLQTDPKGRRIPGFLERLAEKMVLDQASIQNELRSLAKHVEHVKQIVKMQQHYARVSAEHEWVHLSEILEDAAQLAGVVESSGFIVVRDYPEQLAPLHLEKHKLLQILVNLIRNAKHACRDSRRSDGQIDLLVRHQGDEVQICVKDNGIGIAPANQARLFTHGFTTRKDGHGFGLHWSSLAAQQLGGALKAESDGVGLGARFILSLPVGKAGAALSVGTLETPAAAAA
jgi:C4-dicarboxylate-specific signal transduction histidine kinase